MKLLRSYSREMLANRDRLIGIEIYCLIGSSQTQLYVTLGSRQASLVLRLHHCMENGLSQDWSRIPYPDEGLCRSHEISKSFRQMKLEVISTNNALPKKTLPNWFWSPEIAIECLGVGSGEALVGPESHSQ